MGINNINVINIKLEDSNNIIILDRNLIALSDFELTDKLIKEIAQKKSFKNVKKCTITVDFNNISLVIKNYTLTDIIYIEGFCNSISTINILQVDNVGVHITDQRIHNCQLNCPSIFFANCQIQTLDIGYKAHIDSFEKGENIEVISANKIEIKTSNIERLKLFTNCINFNIVESNIGIMDLHKSRTKDGCGITSLYICEYTIIRVIIIRCKIAKLQLDESDISIMHASNGCLIDNIEFNNGNVTTAYDFEERFFIDINVNGWNLVYKSAINESDLNKRAKAQYHLVDYSYRNKKGLNNIWGKVINICTGYGFKPKRTLRVCFGMVVLSGILIFIFDKLRFIFCGITTSRMCWDYLRIAVTAIVGQSGLSYVDGFPYWVTVLENVGAVILFAMFVNALYVRYKD